MNSPSNQLLENIFKRIINDIYLIAILAAILLFSCSQKEANLESIDFKNRLKDIDSIVVYDLDGASDYTTDDLEKANKANIDMIKFKEIIQHIEHKNEKSKIWKGSHFAIGKLNDGTFFKMRIGYPGAFFVIEGVKGCFYFKDAYRKIWENLYIEQIVQNSFRKSRIENRREVASSDLSIHINIIKNQDRGNMVSAIIALGKIGPSAAEAVPLLVKALDDKEQNIRYFSVWALGEIGSPATEALPKLQECLDNKSYGVSDKAIKSAIEKIRLKDEISKETLEIKAIGK